MIPADIELVTDDQEDASIKSSLNPAPKSITSSAGHPRHFEADPQFLSHQAHHLREQNKKLWLFFTVLAMCEVGACLTGAGFTELFDGLFSRGVQAYGR